MDSMKNFKPFLSKGFVSLYDSSKTHPVKILKDIRAAQTLLLESVLPFSEQAFTGRTVLTQGAKELSGINVPLY